MKKLTFSKLLIGNQWDKEMSQATVSQLCNAVYNDVKGDIPRKTSIMMDTMSRWLSQYRFHWREAG